MAMLLALARVVRARDSGARPHRAIRRNGRARSARLGTRRGTPAFASQGGRATGIPVCAVTVAEHTTLDDEACIFMHLVGPLVTAPAGPGDPVRGRVNHVLAGRPARRARESVGRSSCRRRGRSPGPRDEFAQSGHRFGVALVAGLHVRPGKLAASRVLPGGATAGAAPSVALARGPHSRPQLVGISAPSR